MSKKIRIILYGLGEIGRRIGRLITQKEGMEIVGAIELKNIGKDVGVILGLRRKLGILLSNDVEGVLSRECDIVVHSTVSLLPQLREQIIPVIKSGIDVVSTCEELSYPRAHYPEIAEELDKLAKEYRVTVLGTGVNPGYAMDTLPIVLTGPCQEIKRINITRILDAGKRRLPLQKKVGAGLTIDEFRRLVDQKVIRHVGLIESLQLVADSLGWKLDEVKEIIEPVVAEVSHHTEYLTVKIGQVAGVKQVALGVKNNKEVIKLELQMYVGAPESIDSIFIEGTPNIDMIIRGGIPGDIATAAMVVNSIPRVIDAPPGILTMNDIPLVHTI